MRKMAAAKHGLRKRAFWGRGLATDAATGVRDYAFGILTLPRLVALIDPSNGPSIRVAEKVGLRYEKEVLFRDNLCHLYVINRTDLRTLTPPSIAAGASRPGIITQ
jgi:RimJ/RimL family protein N-acetyltransferase